MHHQALLVTLLSIYALAIAACTTTIRPPANPVDPVSVFVIDYGRHSSLMIPRADDSGAPTALREYAYGDWNWFARDRSGVLDILPTLFLPTRGTLGRWDWHIGADKENVKRFVHCEEILELHIARRDATALLAELDARYQSHIDTQIESELYQLRFVHHDQPYHLLNSCNLVLMRWLKTLDCDIEGWPILADFRIPDPL